MLKYRDGVKALLSLSSLSANLPKILVPTDIAGRAIGVLAIRWLNTGLPGESRSF